MRKPTAATLQRIAALLAWLDEYHLAGGQEVSFYALCADDDRTLGEEVAAIRTTLGQSNSVTR